MTEVAINEAENSNVSEIEIAVRDYVRKIDIGTLNEEVLDADVTPESHDPQAELDDLEAEEGNGDTSLFGNSNFR